MGLGKSKTIQTITFLYIRSTKIATTEARFSSPSLCPTSSTGNASLKLGRRIPTSLPTPSTRTRTRSVIYEHELSFEEGAVFGSEQVCKIRTNSFKFHDLLTTYERFSMHASLLSSVRWSALVVDEAHRLKNRQSKFLVLPHAELLKDRLQAAADWHAAAKQP